jgi:hypothetical protein
MDADVIQIGPARRSSPDTDDRLVLVTCSLCLRVRRGSDWIEPELLIRKIRSYELAAPPRLEGALCDLCAGAIVSRRTAAAAAAA